MEPGKETLGSALDKVFTQMVERIVETVTDKAFKDLCDCELSHNGLGIMGRECDCPLSKSQESGK